MMMTTVPEKQLGGCRCSWAGADLLSGDAENMMVSNAEVTVFTQRKLVSISVAK